MFCLTMWKTACLAKDRFPVCSLPLLLNTLKAESMPFTSIYIEADGKMVGGWGFKCMGMHGLMLPAPRTFVLGYSGMSQVVFLIMEPEWQKGKKMTRLIVFSSRVLMTYREGRNVPSVSNLLCDLGRTRFLHFKREQVGSSDL